MGGVNNRYRRLFVPCQRMLDPWIQAALTPSTQTLQVIVWKKYRRHRFIMIYRAGGQWRYYVVLKVKI